MCVCVCVCLCVCVCIHLFVFVVVSVRMCVCVGVYACSVCLRISLSHLLSPKRCRRSTRHVPTASYVPSPCHPGYAPHHHAQTQVCPPKKKSTCILKHEERINRQHNYMYMDTSFIIYRSTCIQTELFSEGVGLYKQFNSTYNIITLQAVECGVL